VQLEKLHFFVPSAMSTSTSKRTAPHRQLPEWVLSVMRAIPFVFETGFDDGSAPITFLDRRGIREARGASPCLATAPSSRRLPKPAQ
jgi:hypothetical protein